MRYCYVLVLCALAALFSQGALAGYYDMTWANYDNYSASDAAITASIHGSDPAAVAAAICPTIVTYTCNHAGGLVDSGNNNGQLWQRYAGIMANGAQGGLIKVIQFYRCPAGSGTWFGTLSGNCTAPPDPCTLSPYASALATPANSYFDFGTDPNAIPNGDMVGCFKSGSQGCLATFEGDFPGGVETINGVKHYYGKGAYRYFSAAVGTTCSTDNLPDPSNTLPPGSCKTGDIKSVVNGVTECAAPDGKPRDENDLNNDGIPDSCHPGSWTTSDGWSVTESWNSSTQTCHQTGTKTGQTDKNQDITPTSPGPWTNPQPNGPGDPTSPNKTVPTDPVGDFCKKNPTSALCVKNSFSGNGCTSAPTCSGDAAMCAMAIASYNLECKFENTKTLSDVLTDSGLTTAATKTAWTSSNASTVDLSTTLQTNQRDLTGSCPAPIAVATPFWSGSVSVQPLCDLASIAGVLVMLAATFGAVRIVSGGGYNG